MILKKLNLRKIISHYTIVQFLGYTIALDDLIERDLLILAKDAWGHFVVPGIGWEGPPAIPGQGYMVKVTQNCRFSWGPEFWWQINNQIQPVEQRLSHFSFDLERAHSSNNMSVVIRNLDIDNEVSDGAEIACFTQDGKIAGAGIFRKSNQAVGLAVWGDERLTDDTVEGLAIGESLTFRMWDPVRDEEFPLSVTPIEGENTYSENGILICDAKAETIDIPGLLPAKFEVTALYPNPFNSNLTVDYFLFESTDIRVGLYSIDGRMLKSVIPDSKIVGNHAITMDASDLSAGFMSSKLLPGIGFSRVRLF